MGLGADCYNRFLQIVELLQLKYLPGFLAALGYPDGSNGQEEPCPVAGGVPAAAMQFMPW